MKNYITYCLTIVCCFILVLALGSCADDEDIASNAEDMMEEPLTGIERVKACFPTDAYQTNSKVIFANRNGITITFNISWEESNSLTRRNPIAFCECSTDNIPSPIFSNPNSHYVYFNLKAENFVHYSACFTLISINNPEGSTYEDQNGDSALLWTSSRRNTPTSSEIFVIGDDLFSLPKEEDFGENVSLLDQNFESVIQAEFEENDGLRKVYFNETFGLVAFEDEFNDLYVFDHFEE